MEFLIFSNNRKPIDDNLVAFALSRYYTMFKRKPPIARVHPSQVETLQAIIARLHGKLDVQPNGGTFSDELELAKPEKRKPAQMRLEL
jgi:hypothetical protein